MPAAAVIPAPIAYIVGFRGLPAGLPNSLISSFIAWDRFQGVGTKAAGMEGGVKRMLHGLAC